MHAMMGHTDDEGLIQAATIAELQQVFDRQHAAFLADGAPSAEVRIDRIDRAISLLVEHKQAICEAISEDFGCRAHERSAACGRRFRAESRAGAR